MAAMDIKGRDAFSATSGTGAFYQAPINIGPSNSGLTLSSPAVLAIAAVAAVALFLALKRR